MSNDLAARVERMELLVTALVDELLEVKAIPPNHFTADHINSKVHHVAAGNTLTVTFDDTAQVGSVFTVIRTSDNDWTTMGGP